MTLYLDANVLVGALLTDALNERAATALATQREKLAISDLAAAEFTAVVGRRMRNRELAPLKASSALADLDQWIARKLTQVSMLGNDLRTANALLRRLDLPLSAPDAIHIALAIRLGARLLTFDVQMRQAAVALGCPVVAGA